jgi:hypothetical protein
VVHAQAFGPYCQFIRLLNIDSRSCSGSDVACDVERHRNDSTDSLEQTYCECPEIRGLLALLGDLPASRRRWSLFYRLSACREEWTVKIGCMDSLISSSRETASPLTATTPLRDCSLICSGIFENVCTMSLSRRGLTSLWPPWRPHFSLV